MNSLAIIIGALIGVIAIIIGVILGLFGDIIKDKIKTKSVSNNIFIFVEDEINRINTELYFQVRNNKYVKVHINGYKIIEENIKSLGISSKRLKVLLQIYNCIQKFNLNIDKYNKLISSSEMPTNIGELTNRIDQCKHKIKDYQKKWDKKNYKSNIF